MSKSAIDAQMARMQADGVTVVRTWGFNHQGTWHVFEPSKGVYNEPEFREFDYILNSASNHNMRVIVALENYWTAYGGIDTRLTWEGLTGGDPGSIGGSPGRRIFFTNGPAIQGYTNYVQYFLNRTNHYTGLQYKNDQTIFAWEVMNEPRYQNESSSQNMSGTKLRAWMDSVGAFIKAVDTNHLLGTGLEGQGSAYGYGGDNGAPFIYIHQSPYIDFCSAHVYPTESWANLSIAQTTNLIITWAHDAHVTVGKPFFLGEFNMMNGNSYGTRSNWWVATYQTIQNQNIGGSAFWWYEEANIDGTYGVQQGAPELAVFRAHSAVMQAKSAGASVTTTLGLTTSGSPSTYGNAVTFIATVRTNGVAVGNISGETVAFYDGTAALGTGTVNGSGQATNLTSASQLSAATHAITVVYAGDATYTGSTNSPALSQTVNQATLTYTANSAGMTYGSSIPALSGSVSGFVSGENQGNATTGTLIFTTPATPSSSMGTYAINGSGLTANNGNYNFTQATANATALTINALAVNLTGSRPYDGTTTAPAGILSVANKVGGDDVTVASGSGTVAAATVGLQAISSFGTLALGGTMAGNYTLSGASGSVNILPLVTPTFTGQMISVGSGGWQLSFSAQAGQTYKVLASDDLKLPLNQWTVLTNGTFGAGTATITDNSTNLPIRFYQIVSP
jgi:mannan endo-1,4-beta-mannosidase